MTNEEFKEWAKENNPFSCRNCENYWRCVNDHDEQCMTYAKAVAWEKGANTANDAEVYAGNSEGLFERCALPTGLQIRRVLELYFKRKDAPCLGSQDFEYYEHNDECFDNVNDAVRIIKEHWNDDEETK